MNERGMGGGIKCSIVLVILALRWVVDWRGLVSLFFVGLELGELKGELFIGK